MAIFPQDGAVGAGGRQPQHAVAGALVGPAGLCMRACCVVEMHGGRVASRTGRQSAQQDEPHTPANDIATHSHCPQAHLFEVLPGVHVCQIEKDAGGWAQGTPLQQLSATMTKSHTCLLEWAAKFATCQSKTQCLTCWARLAASLCHLSRLCRQQPGLHARVWPAGQPAAAHHDEAQRLPHSHTRRPAAARHAQHDRGTAVGAAWGDKWLGLGA